LTHTKIYTNIHNITNIRLCSTVQSIVRDGSTASDTETAQERRHKVSGKLPTQCSHDSQQSTVSATKDRSANPADRRSNTGHTDFWWLQALRGRGWRRRLVSGWSGSGPRQPNVSSPTWTRNSSSTPHTQYSRLTDRRRKLRSRTVITCPERLHDRLK